MGNPTGDDSDQLGRDTLKDSQIKDNVNIDEYFSRPKPTCQTLQQDLMKIHAIVRTTKTEVLNSMNTGLDDILTNPDTGVLCRLSALEESSAPYEKRLASVEEKLAIVETGENVILQSSPTQEAEIADLKQRLDTTTAILQSFEKKLHTSNSRILHNTQLVNVNNYKISGIPFKEGEDPFVETKMFLTNIMSVTVNDGDIIVASHIPGTITVRVQGNRVELPPPNVHESYSIPSKTHC